MLINDINLVIGGVCLALSVVGLLQTLFSPQLEQTTKRFFLGFFGILIAYAVSVLITTLSLDGAASLAMVSKVGVFAESTFSSLLMLLLTWFILISSGESDWLRSAAFRAALVLWLIYIALLVYTQLSVSIYYIDSSNVYHRGPYYPVLLVPPVLIMALNAQVFLRRRGKFSKQLRAALLAFLIVPIASMLIQMAVYGIYTIALGTTVAALVMFTYIQQEQTGRFYQKEQENTQLRVDIMLSQIRPHFLYNALGAIQSLCRSDPKTAEKAVASFSRYLRGNMDSITQRKAIPFQKELEHTRLYLELEQLRFEDALQVVYDLETTDFLLPTLTLQPLAENAVRHGVRGKPDGRGTVTISTRETPDCYTVTVSDDGPGFDPAQPPQDGSSHIGLANVRERLQSVAGGRLEIDSAPGQGTRASIIIPREG